MILARLYLIIHRNVGIVETAAVAAAEVSLYPFIIAGIEDVVVIEADEVTAVLEIVVVEVGKDVVVLVVVPVI